MWFTGSGETEEAGWATAASGEEDSCVVVTSEEHLLTGHTGAVVCMAMHEDRLLFTGSTDCTIKVCSQHFLACVAHCVSTQPGLLGRTLLPLTPVQSSMSMHLRNVTAR